MDGADRQAAPRIADVAARAGVSTKTVSAVVNGVGQVRASTRERVLAAVAEVGYRANPAARRLSAGLGGTIALAVPQLGSAEAAALASAVIRAAEAVDLEVLCVPTESGAREVDALVALAGTADGVLLSPSGSDVPRVEGLPVVVVGGRRPAEDTDSVCAPTQRAVDLALDRLRAAGRRRPVVLASGPSLVRPTAGERPVDVVVAADGTSWAAHAALAAALDRGRPETAVRPPVDGIVAVGQEAGLGVLRLTADRGISVPAEVAVIAVGAGDEARFAWPSLATVEPDLGALARAAIELLLSRVAGDAGPPVRIDVPHRLHDRESLRPPI